MRRGEFDPELLVLGVIVGLAVCGALWLVTGLPLPACLVREWTGLPCLTCGGSRCVQALIAGDFAGAAGWNPLVFVGAGAAAVFGVYAAIVTALRLPRLRIVSLPRGAWIAIRLGAALAVTVNWIYLIFRLSRAG